MSALAAGTPGTSGGQKGTLSSLGLELQMVVNCHMDAST